MAKNYGLEVLAGTAFKEASRKSAENAKTIVGIERSFMYLSGSELGKAFEDLFRETLHKERPDLRAVVHKSREEGGDCRVYRIEVMASGKEKLSHTFHLVECKGSTLWKNGTFRYQHINMSRPWSRIVFVALDGMDLYIRWTTHDEFEKANVATKQYHVKNDKWWYPKPEILLSLPWLYELKEW